MASPGCCWGCVTGEEEPQASASASGRALSASLVERETLCCPLPTRMLYWSEVGSLSRLMEATMDGSRRHVLLAQGLGWPTALALDLPASRIFWLDEKLSSVGSARLDGTDVKVRGGCCGRRAGPSARVSSKGLSLLQVLQLGWVRSPFAAAVCEGQLYWSEGKTWSVQQVDKATGKNRTVLLKRHGQPHGLQVPTRGSPEPCCTRSTWARGVEALRAVPAPSP